jgi:hypothetical protein
MAPPVSGIPALGDGTHSLADVEVLTIVGSDWLAEPSDVAIRPDVPSELWITTRQNDSIVIVSGVGTEGQTVERYAASGNTHFLPRPSALAFGTPDRLATAHEIAVPTQRSTPADFMGPTLWPTDTTLFDGGHASHMDMLHNSPNAVGIAWETGNAYWVVDGYHGSLTRYDFVADHGPGQEDHSDGIIARYVEGEIGYLEGVPAHAELDHETGLLYVADPANGRVVALDIATGTRGGNISPNYDGAEQYEVEGATLTTVIVGADVGLARPSGLALHEGHLYVSDHFNSTIAAFELETMELVDWVSVAEIAPSGSLGGIALDAEGRIYFADLVGSQVLRLAAR